MTLARLLAFALLSTATIACGDTPGAVTVKRAPLAQRWLDRAGQSYRAGDIDDAKSSIDSAQQAAPHDLEVRIFKARVDLARLDYSSVIKLTEGIQTTEAHQLRGRAFWYSGDIDQAADELEAMLQDPTVKDPWAKEVAKLARRGQGRHPFAVEGAVVTAVEMPQAGPALVVPCELEGESVLALVATAVSELVIDSSARGEPAWVNLRFGDRFEIHDVPALTQDLGPVSRQFGAPIKALLGVNLLRHAHVTFDRRGDQFVVRKDDPPAPPDASRVPLFYVRGGGMMLRAGVNAKADGLVPFLVDTSSFFPLALDDSTFGRAGVDLSTFRPEPGAPPNVKTGMLPTLRFGGFDLPQVPTMEGAPLAEVRQNLDVDLGGVVGAGLLSVFRVTFGDDGRFVWIEPDPTLAGQQEESHTGPPPAPPPQGPPMVPDGPLGSPQNGPLTLPQAPPKNPPAPPPGGAKK